MAAVVYSPPQETTVAAPRASPPAGDLRQRLHVFRWWAGVPRGLRDAFVAGGLLAAVLLVFFGQPLFGGSILSPADRIFSTPYYSALAPHGYSHASNGLLFDQVFQFAPWRHFAWTSLRQGRLPVWNPLSLSGTPLIATMQTAVFYPINLLLTALAFPSTFLWSAILRLWIAGMFTYLLARRSLLGRAAAFLAAVSFMLCGFLVVWLGHPHTNVAIWLPALLFFGEGIVRARDRRQLLISTALLALVTGIQFTGGHIETSVDILFGFAVYCALRIIQVLRRGPARGWVRSRLIVLGAATFLGTGVAAVQLAPFVEWVPLSAEFAHRVSGAFRPLSVSFVAAMFQLPTILFPNIYNNPTWPNPDWPYFGWWPNYNESVFYVGILTLVLALVAVRHRFRANPFVWTYAILGLVGLGRALSFPIFDWINQLPILSLGNSSRFRLVFAFSLCMLAGFGAQELWSARRERRVQVERLFVRLCVAVVALGALVAIFGNLLLPLVRDRLIVSLTHLADRAYASRQTHTNTLDFYHQLVIKIMDGLIGFLGIGHVTMYAPALLALAAIMLVAIRRRGLLPANRTFQVTIVFAVVLDLLAFGKGYNPTIDPSHFYPATPVDSSVAANADSGRITAVGGASLPDAQMMPGLSDVRGDDFLTRWYKEYTDLIPGHRQVGTSGVVFSSVDSPLLRVLNIRYVVSSRLDDVAQNGIQPVGSQGSAWLGEVTAATPRAFMVYRAEVARTDQQALAILAADPQAVYTRVVLSDGTALPSDSRLASGTSTATQGLVFPGASSPTTASFTVKTAVGGYLFESDAYYPGWTVRVDGESANLYRANVAFRAVYVPAGTHVVTFRYEPRSVAIGLIITIASLILILVMMILSRLRAGQPARSADSWTLFR